MKAKHFLKWFCVLMLFLALPACAPAQVQEFSTGASSPQAWFDAPLPGSVFSPGEIQIIAHGASETGISEVELSIQGGEVIGSQIGKGGETLLTAAVIWHPPDPGHYTLQARVLSASGDWSEYAFTDVVIAAEEDMPPETAQEPSPTPTLEEQAPAQPAEPTSTPTVQAAAEPTPTNTPEPCTNLAAFVSETVKDDTVFKPSTAFTKTWTLRNAGTCTWTKDYGLSFYDGERMSGPSFIPLTKAVRPGEKVTLSVDLNAPAKNGTFKGRWMMMNDAGILFGLGDQGTVAFWVQIIVQRQDTKAPSVEVSYSPSGRGQPTGRQKVTFTATASDNVGVVKIEIYLARAGQNWQLLGTCNNQNTCSLEKGPFTPDNYTLQAVAYDAAGNKGSSTIVSLVVYR